MNGSGIKDVWSMEAWAALEERALPSIDRLECV